MEWFIPLFMMSRVAKAQRGALVEQLLPMALPGPATMRLTFAAINAEQHLTRQMLADRDVLAELVNNAFIKNLADLDKLPAVKRLYDGLPPDIQATIFPPAQINPRKPA